MSSNPAPTSAAPGVRDIRAARAPFAAFAGFGAFWGAWGAALPALRTASGVSEGQLGTALLFVGLGALPSMAFTGRVVDRFGLRVGGWLLATLAGAGVLTAVGAHGMTLLVVAMLLVGAASGATDVAINTLAGRAEHVSSRPLLTRSHGVFSVGVVVASLATGGMLGAGWSPVVTFAVVAAVMVALALAAGAWSAVLESTTGRTTATDAPVAAGQGVAAAGRRGAGVPALPLFVVGLVAALAYAIENAHQSWGALMLTDVFRSSPQLAAAAPAAFAATAAVARLGLAPLTRSNPTTVLLGGGALATVGTALLAWAPSVGVALAGLVLAALGTATLFPTLLSRSLRSTDPALHARATSRVATTAYLGFLLGPAYVGQLADRTGLRGAMLGVAVLAVIFTVAVAPVSGWASRTASAPRAADAGRAGAGSAGASRA